MRGIIVSVMTSYFCAMQSLLEGLLGLNLPEKSNQTCLTQSGFVGVGYESL